MKLLFVGSRSVQSAATLAALLAQGIIPDALFVDTLDNVGNAVGHLLPPLIDAGDKDGVLALAAAHGIPARTGPPQQLACAMREYQPRRVLVSCYPHRISDSLLEAAPLGWFNIHPSLLPDYRGITPIFWQLRDGLDHIGVTLHRMDSQYDQGPIIAQCIFGLDDFPDYSDISRHAGRIGAWLFLCYLDRSAGPWAEELSQAALAGSGQGYPRQEDFAIDPGWSAARQVRFVKGVRDLGAPFLESHACRHLIRDAAIAEKGRLGMPVPGQWVIHCYDGDVALHIQRKDTLP